MRVEHVDLGSCSGYRWEPDEGAERYAIALPGALLAGTPGVSVAVYALIDRGFGVVQVWDEFLDRSLDPTAWIRERAEAAIAAAGRPVELVVAKSLSTRAAGLAAERSLAAVWLTPLLNDPETVEALRRRTAPALVIGGTDDPIWDGALARKHADEVLELAGTDHGLCTSEGTPGLLANLGRVAETVDAFAGRL